MTDETDDRPADNPGASDRKADSVEPEPTETEESEKRNNGGFGFSRRQILKYSGASAIVAGAGWQLLSSDDREDEDEMWDDVITGVTVEQPADGVVELTGDARAVNTTVPAELPDLELAGDDRVSLRFLSVELADEAEIELRIENEAPVGNPQLSPGYELEGSFQLDYPDGFAAAVEQVWFGVAVDREQIVNPDSFALHRETENGYEPLSTVRVGSTPTEHHYFVRSDGLSNFVTGESGNTNIVSVDGGDATDLLYLEDGDGVVGDLVMPDNITIDESGRDLRFIIETNASDLEATFDLSTREPAEFDFAGGRIDLADTPVPEEPVELFTIENTSDDSVLCRAFVNHPEILLIKNIGDKPDSVDSPLRIDPGESWAVGISVGDREPDNVLVASLNVPIVVDRQGNPVFGDDTDYFFRENASQPVAWSDDISPAQDGTPSWPTEGADSDSMHHRIPMWLTVQHEGDREVDEMIRVNLSAAGGDQGDVLGFQDVSDIEDATQTVSFSDGPQDSLSERFVPTALPGSSGRFKFHMTTESKRNGINQGNPADEMVLNDIGDLELEVQFVDFGSGNEYEQWAGEDSISRSVGLNSPGESIQEEGVQFRDDAMERWATETIAAVFPYNVTTALRLWQLQRGLRRGVVDTDALLAFEIVDQVDNVETIVEDASDPDPLQDLFLRLNNTAEGLLLTAVIESGDDDDAPFEDAWPNVDGISVGMFGPTIIVTDGVEPYEKPTEITGLEILERSSVAVHTL